MKERGRKRSMQLALILIIAVITAVIFTLIDGWTALGRRPTGERLARIQRSPQYQDGRFRNPQPLYNDYWGMLTNTFSGSAYATPKEALPVVRPEHARHSVEDSNGLRVTWLGHSTQLIEIDGHRVLTDPIWSQRSSPLTWIGPQRWYAPAIAIDDLPELDAVVISHDHYDHLDEATIRTLARRGNTFVVPLGVGSHLAYWGVPESHIIELDWWDEVTIRGLRIVATPARHASGRLPFFGMDKTLWAGFALIGKKHRAYYSGDTGLFPGLAEIGERLGPFDVTMIETGAYGRWWPDWHLGPEQAVKAHRMVRGREFIPVHWGLFKLAYHGWTEPVERLIAAAEKERVSFAVPKPGEMVNPSSPPVLDRWWPSIPWNNAAQDPITATKMNQAE